MNVKIKISSQIEIDKDQLPQLIRKQIEQDLTLQNPNYLKAVKYGNSTYGIPKIITLYEYQNNKLILPRGIGSKVIRYLKKAKVPYQIIDERLTLPEVQFPSKIRLRDYQAQAVEDMLYWRQGGIVAPCGSGKTMIMLEAMARIGQPALWITHTKELADQVIQRASEMFDMYHGEIGFIGSGKWKIKNRLTVALIQTLSRSDLSEIKNSFGAIFVDEAHRLAAKSFYEPVNQFPALYRFWVSATPDRTDGLTEMIYAAGGSVINTINQCNVPTIIPELKVIETNYEVLKDDYTKQIADLIKDKQRNELIVGTIAQEAKGNYSLVLSDRVEHVERLKRMLKKSFPNMTIEILTGSMKKEQRDEIMKRVQAKRVDILLATQLAREGLDIKHLNRLFLVTPKKAAGAVQQEVGRIMRPEEGKVDAVVFDFYDHLNPILKSQFYKRKDVYKKIGMVL